MVYALGAVGGGVVPAMYDNPTPSNDVTGFEIGSSTTYDNTGNAVTSPFMDASTTYDNRQNGMYSHNGQVDAFDMSKLHVT